MSATTTAESLFREVFLPLYPEDAKSDLGRSRSLDANPANNPNVLAHLEEATQIFAKMAPTILGIPEAELALDGSSASVHRLSKALTPETRAKLLAMGDLGSADNALFNFVVHGAAYVGDVIVKHHGGRWAVRRPLWESLVFLASRSGEGELPVFHWLLKSFADAAEGAARVTLADRYRAHVEVPTTPVDELPVLVPPDRNLPKLKRPRYDAFYKYLRAHLPEVKDVGEDFPSPERFEELRFETLSFLPVGGGRMLLVHGPNEHGLHAFWIGKAGFEKSAFWPADKFPAPMLRAAADDKLEVLLSKDGKPQSFELLWWGP